MEYQQTQQAFLPVALWIGFLAILGFLIPTKNWAPWIGVFVLAITIVMLVFSRLTVTVTNQTIGTAFGFGWPKHTEQVSDVLTASQVRNSWIHGWGIRKISGGWMYNVSGYDAIALDLRSGKKFRIGTDEPEVLLATITMVLPASESGN